MKVGKRHNSRCRYYGQWPSLRPDRRNRMQDLRRLTVAILCALLAILQDARGEVVRIATWNLEWFPGGKPNSSQAERLVHMSAAKDALDRYSS